MHIAFVSNWESLAGCGVALFGRNFARALEVAGHVVFRASWTDALTLGADRVLVNWDSGTLPQDASALREQATFYVHHTYRGEPSPLPSGTHVLLSPMKGYGHYFPYPVPTYRSTVKPRDRVLGVTTIRKEGVDYLQQACRQAGWTLDVPDRWRETEDEIDRLAGCAAVAAWYTDSPGRSLALATMIAAERPLLLSFPSRMFEFLNDRGEPYWTPYSNQSVEGIVATLRQIEQDLREDTVRRVNADEWSWPAAIAYLERLWRTT